MSIGDGDNLFLFSLYALPSSVGIFGTEQVTISDNELWLHCHVSGTPFTTFWLHVMLDTSPPDEGMGKGRNLLHLFSSNKDS